MGSYFRFALNDSEGILQISSGKSETNQRILLSKAAYHPEINHKYKIVGRFVHVPSTSIVVR